MSAATSLERRLEAARLRTWITQRELALVVEMAASVDLGWEVVAEELGLEPGQAAELLAGEALRAAVDVSTRYQLLRAIGEGGMGAVYLAIDRQLRRRVAIKLMHRSLMSERHLERFRREAAVMARIRHPGCVQVFDVGATPDGSPFLVLEYVEGRSLAEVIGGGEVVVAPGQVARWGRDVAEALHASHGVGVVHRDVKPSNVLVDTSDQARLTDFGVAHDQAADTQLTQGAAVGTLLYLAPEILTGGTPTVQSDVYALGATLYEALVGRPPFVAQSTYELLGQIASEEPLPPSQVRAGVPPDLETVILRCLEKRPEARYGSAREVALELARFLGGVPVLARRASWVERALRTAVRNRYLVLGSFGALVLGATTALAGLGLRERRGEAFAEACIAQAEVLGNGSSADSVNALDRMAALIDEGLRSGQERTREKARALRQRERGLRALARAENELARHGDVVSAIRNLRPARPLVAFQGTRGEYEIAAGDPLSRRRRQLERMRETCFLEATSWLAAASVDLEEAATTRAKARLQAQAALALWDFEPDRAFRHLLSSGQMSQVASLVVPFEGLARCRPVAPEPDTADPRWPLEVSLPGSLELSPGPWCIDIQPARALMPWSLAVYLRPGERRELQSPSLDLSRLPTVLRDDLVLVPSGLPRRGSFPPHANRTSPFLVLRTELPFEVWLSFVIAQGLGPVALPSGIRQENATRALAGLARQKRIPTDNVRLSDVQRFLLWLGGELSLRGLEAKPLLPSLAQLHWATRGEFPWAFPWGLAGSGWWCKNPERLRIRPVASAPEDVSPFGVRDLAVSLRELSSESMPAFPDLVLLHGGSDWDALDQLRGRMERASLLPRQRSEDSPEPYGFRFVIPLPLPEQKPRPRHPGESQRALARAEEARARGDYRGAMELCTEALRLDGLNVQAWIERGWNKLRLHDCWGAWWDCAQALELQPECGDRRLWLTYAVALRGSERWERARPVLDVAIAKNPRAYELLAHRGFVRMKLHDLVGAFVDLQAFLERAPESDPNRGEVLRKVGVLREAIARGVARDPEPEQR
ncbi:MAG: protein kinase [Planctomycetota bacterium]